MRGSLKKLSNKLSDDSSHKDTTYIAESNVAVAVEGPKEGSVATSFSIIGDPADFSNTEKICGCKGESPRPVIFSVRSCFKNSFLFK